MAKKKEQTNQKRKKYAVKSDTKRSDFASGNLGIDKQTSRSSKRKVSLSRDLKDLNFVLIDDVITTGSTITECIKTLNNAGIKNVYVITFAKTSYNK